MSSSNTKNDGTLVCVTGANGYIASWIIKFLLDRGYRVRGTVREPVDQKKINHLIKLDGARERLELIKANLQEEGSYDKVVENCEGVFHTASPFYYKVEDPQTELVDPAVNGTLNVLKSCAKSPSVKRVILTSSMVAVTQTGKHKNPEDVVDETWFSDPDFCRQSEYWYVLSKTLAEEAAWKFVKENNMDMVTINPGMAIGPLLQPTLNASAGEILNLIKGAKTFPNFNPEWINVKDIANAHIQAFEIPSANGRYCLVERVAHYADVVKILNELYPQFEITEKCRDDRPLMPKHDVSKEKAKTLGIEFIPLDVSLKEIVESLKEKKFVKF